MTPYLDTLVSNFRECARLAGIFVPEVSITLEQFSAPHRPPSTLAKNRFAVYAFFWNNQCLKVGKVGQNSQARFTSQHYLPSSSNSNLAKSVLAHKDELGLNSLTDATVGNWIKENTERANFILDAQLGIPVLSLLEAFLQSALRPRFEGFASQRGAMPPNPTLKPCSAKVSSPLAPFLATTETGRDKLSTISMFYGILIRMFFRDTQKHPLSHIHADFQGKVAVYSIPDGTLLAGDLPQNKHKLVVAWIEIHQEDLLADWELAVNGKKPFTIKGLDQ